MSKCAIITGIYGQDGSLLAERLLADNYHVVGFVRERQPGFPSLASVQIVETDIADPARMSELFHEVRPNECYHLAAAHHSSENERGAELREQMLRTNFQSTQALLDALLKTTPACRFFYAGSSQMHTAENDVTVVHESTPYRPSTYYGVTKAASAHLIDLSRRERGLWGVTGVLFNHESTRRSAQYISRKIARAAATFRANPNSATSKLNILDITARADWSAATDIVHAMHLSLQADTPADYVLASGEVHSVRELLNAAFGAVGLEWKDYVMVERSPDAPQKPCLQGNPQRARTILNWKPEKSLSDLICEMVMHDLRTVQSKPDKEVEVAG